MKKLIALVMLASIAMAMFGCAAPEEGDTAPTTPEATTPADAE